MIPLTWTNLASSKISRVKFEPNKHDLRGDLLVEFNEGKVYRYKDVPANTVERLVHASSPGKYFDDNVRSTYTMTRE